MSMWAYSYHGRTSGAVVLTHGFVESFSLKLQLRTNMLPHDVSEPLFLLQRRRPHGGVVTAHCIGSLRKPPKEFTQMFGMLANIERFGDNAAGSIPAQEPCAGTCHGNRVVSVAVLAREHLGSESDV